MRKYDLYFGPFEYYAPICADAADKYKRYVTNEPGHLILIDNYMVKCLNLETAANKIDKNSYFTVIPQSAERINGFQMPSAELADVSASSALQKSAEYDCSTSSALRTTPENYV